MKVLALAASNSSKSINKQFVAYAGRLLQEQNSKIDIEYLDINDYAMPIYSSDLEEAHGVPEQAKQFLAKIAQADILLISYAEHNGGYTVAYKNLFDWASRVNVKVYQGKSMVMLSTSPGPGGAARVLNIAAESARVFDGNVLATMSLPGFYDNFDMEAQIINNSELNQKLTATLSVINKD